MNRLGIALVISAPSGTGKTTLIKRLRKEFPNFGYSISCTTRAPREGEVDGKDYHFLSRERFVELRDQGHFAEWAEVHGNFYGTPLPPVREMLAKGQDILFDIDVQGAAQLRKNMPDARFLFILPPSMEELERRLRGRGLDGVKLVVGDKCLGMLEAVGEVFPEAKYQRCTVHFYRNVFSVTPRSKVKLVAKMLKAIHAQESKKAAREKAKAVVEQLRSMKLKEAAKKVEDGIEETLTYCDFPSEHWTRIRTNNVIERLNREIRRRTRVVGSFPDGNSALMLVCARLRHVAGTQWGNKKYMNMKHLEAALEDASIAG